MGNREGIKKMPYLEVLKTYANIAGHATHEQ